MSILIKKETELVHQGSVSLKTGLPLVLAT